MSTFNTTSESTQTQAKLCKCGCGNLVVSTKPGVVYLKGHNTRMRFDPVVVRLWASVEKTDGCWIWKGHVTSTGYGKILVGGKYTRVHRFSYELKYGPIESGFFVLHHCDQKRCVNPDHLWAGTHAQNMKDMTDKNRQAKGVANASHRLTEDEVREIRAATANGARVRDLAKQFKVNTTTVRRIINGTLWRHLDREST